MANPSETKLDSLQVERLSDRLRTLEHLLQSNIAVIEAQVSHPETMPPNVVQMRVSLRRARNAFRRLGNGSFTLSALTLAAFLKVLFDGSLTLLPAFIIVTAAVFLGLIGYIFYLQADNIDIGDSNE